MRVVIDIEQDGGECTLTLAAPCFPATQRRPLTWLADKRLLVAKGTAMTGPDAAALAQTVEQCDADGGDAQQQRECVDSLRRYGGLLFDAAFAPGEWEQLVREAAAPAGGGYLEVVINGCADGDHAALQALRWEALCHGKKFVAAEGASGAGGAYLPVGIVRQVMPCPPGARCSAGNPARGTGPEAAAGPYKEVIRIPRVLFAVGSQLTGDDVRAGAEFMGIMRRMERNGGSVQPRVLDCATRSLLVGQLAAFRPDVLHLIGHGRRRKDGQVEVQLRPEPSGEAWLTADGLLSVFAQARYWPAMMVLSACQTASPDAGALGPGDRAADDDDDAAIGDDEAILGDDEVPAARVSGLSFAARIVAGNEAARGVPVVVAMGGDISDTACRVFTQAMAAAVAEGTSLAKAVIAGRAAAFYDRPGPVSGHWAMPALFLAGGVPEDARLVNPERAGAARVRVEKLGMAIEPVFCGRSAFIEEFDRLLDGTNPRNVLLACMPNATDRFGSKRLLQELGARAVRADVLPVMLAFPRGEAPGTLLQFAQAFRLRLTQIHKRVPGFPDRPWAWRSRTVEVAQEESDRVDAAEDTDWAQVAEDLGEAMRADVDQLLQELTPDDPVRSRPEGEPRAVLLLHRVELWDGLGRLLVHLFDPAGLAGGRAPLPVVLTGADVNEVKVAHEQHWTGPTWVECLQLGRLSAEEKATGAQDKTFVKNEDLLAYRWWLLNPLEASKVYALKPHAMSGWPKVLRRYLGQGAIYPRLELYDVQEDLDDYFTSADDDVLLVNFANLLPTQAADPR